MDAPLQAFVDSVENLSDIRNVSLINPVSFYIENPTTAVRFLVFGAVNEPNGMGVPINTIWVVLDNSSLYNKRALQLKSLDSPLTSGVPNVITDASYTQSWVELENYVDMFAELQYYASGGSGVGPKGDPGLVFRGAYSAIEVYSMGDCVTNAGSSWASRINSNTGNTPVEGANWQLIAQAGETPVIDYDYIINTVLGLLEVTVDHITLTGLPLTLVEGQTAQLTVMATLTNATEQNVTNTCTYAVVPPTAGTVSLTGLFTANQVDADVPFTVTATYTPEVTPYTDDQTSTVQDRYVVGITINGATSVNDGATSNYTISATYNIGAAGSIALPNANITLGTDLPLLATINSSGVLTAIDPGAVVITATYNDGIHPQVQDTHNVTINAIAVAVYGVGPAVGNVSAYDQAFFDGLAQHGSFNIPGAAIPDVQITLNSGAPASGQFMYLMYPASKGFARFEDSASPGFFGGWDGANLDPINGPYGPYVATIGAVQYNVYRTDYDGLGSITWNVDAQP